MPGLITLGHLLKGSLTSAEVREMLTIMEGAAPSKALLHRWASTGLVTPSVLSVGKQGRWNLSLYSWSDFAQLRLVMRLRREGLSMLKVKTIFLYRREQLIPALVEGSARSIQVLRNGTADVTTTEREVVPAGQAWLRFALAEFATGNLAVRDLVRSTPTPPPREVGPTTAPVPRSLGRGPIGGKPYTGLRKPYTGF